MAEKRADNTIGDAASKAERADEEQPPKSHKMEQALRFWNHPSLVSSTSQEKLEYLAQHKGFTQEELDELQERLSREEMPATRHGRALVGTTGHYEEQHPSSWTVPFTIGGALGLAGAATLRWLNGGEFDILPPTQTVERDAQRENHSDDEDERGDDGEQDEDLDGEEEQYYTEVIGRSRQQQVVEEEAGSSAVAKQVQELASIVKKHCEVQEKWLKTVSEKSSHDLTNRSMDLLLKRSSPSSGSFETPNLSLETAISYTLLYSQLVELRTELTMIRFSLQPQHDISEGVEEKLTDLIQSIATCLEKVEYLVQQQRQEPHGTCTNNVPSVPRNVETPFTCESTDASSGENTTGTPQRKKDISLVSSSPPDPIVVSSPHSVSSCQGPCTSNASLAEALQHLEEENDQDDLKAGAQMLYLYAINLTSHPNVPRYRKIYTTNESYRNTVGRLKGATAVLTAMGFKGDSLLVWQGDATDEADMNRLKEAAAALSILKTVGKTGTATSSDKLNTVPNTRAQASTPVPPFPEEEEDREPFSTPQHHLISPPCRKKRIDFNEIPLTNEYQAPDIDRIPPASATDGESNSMFGSGSGSFQRYVQAHVEIESEKNMPVREEADSICVDEEKAERQETKFQSIPTEENRRESSLFEEGEKECKEEHTEPT